MLGPSSCRSDCKHTTRLNQTLTAANSRLEVAFVGDPAPLAAVTQPVSGGKENLAEDAAAIVAQAGKLGPLLQRAEQVLVQHQEAKAGRQVQSGASLGLT